MSSKKNIPLPETFGLPPVGVETHAHLDFPEFSEDLDQVLDRARAAGVTWFGNIFLSPEAYRTHQPRLSAIVGMFFTLGIHPHEATTVTPDVLADMAELFAQNQDKGKDKGLRALGEIGLDFYWDRSPRDVQIQAFQDQLALARELDLPVIVHSREAEPETLAILLEMGFKDRPLLWHCFGQGRELADQVLAHGWHISIPGPVTFPKSTALRQAIPHIPLSRMVLETDCPFLTPHPFRGKRNEPAYLCYTAQVVAELRGQPIQEVWTACGDTARTFFNLEE
ncbi:TatD family hydrolase [Desulfonatronum sp. SC1]|uniref:TatD family hydrolase n=1 Tax=Desulfonatronum sp. SC1 TaxID=2109626 RepID=UPI000D31EB58|nr:TatD family hydrolase [Desulfonatronum sp. SC1]PTN38690.1 TatD family deoxyribonuclease [Desulfonatronum sp. SC1]